MGLQVNALTTVAAVAAELGLALPPGVSTWSPGTTYASSALVEPPRPNGRYYKVTAGGGGASGASQPAWSSATGATFTDGALTWTDQGASQQGRLERLVNASADAFERFCSRKFVYGQWTESMAGMGKNRLIVSRTPIISVVSVSFQGAAIDPTEYEIEGQIGSEPSRTGFIYRQIGWTWTSNYVLSAEPYRLPGSEFDLYQVVYLGGFQTPQLDGQAGQNGAPARAADLPAELEQMAIEHVASMWRKSGYDRNNLSESFDEAKAQRTENAEMIPEEIQRGLLRYKRFS